MCHASYVYKWGQAWHPQTGQCFWRWWSLPLFLVFDGFGSESPYTCTRLMSSHPVSHEACNIHGAGLVCMYTTADLTSFVNDGPYPCAWKENCMVWTLNYQYMYTWHPPPAPDHCSDSSESVHMGCFLIHKLVHGSGDSPSESDLEESVNLSLYVGFHVKLWTLSSWCWRCLTVDISR